MSYKGCSENNDLDRDPRIYIVTVLILMLILLVRLFDMQVVHYNLYFNKSEDYRIKRVILEAPRGIIYDRNGEILATNRMSYEVTVDPFQEECFAQSLPKLVSIVPNLPDLLGITRYALVDSVKKMARGSLNPITLIHDADFQTMSLVEEHSLELPGIGCTIGQRRYYPHGELACHILGYMGKMTPAETARLIPEGYYRNQWIGKYGVERNYENQLKGENGVKFMEKNYLNRFLDTLNDYKPIPPVPGGDVNLTIDYRLQEVAEKCFGDTIRGAIIAMDPRNGEILALASAPEFDPNEFVSVMTNEEYASLVNDPENPFINRAIQGTYPPGSTFKMVTALAGLEMGIDENTRFQPCTGSYYFGREYKCWEEAGHGSLDMINAIAQSCNVYYYQLGRKVGLEQWSATAKKLGIGSLTGIDLPGEVSGNLPSPEFYKKLGVEFSPGMILNLAIGQGENAVTPLQLAHYVSIIATEGIDARPHVVKNNEQPQMVEGISRHSFQVVKEGMYGVVNYPAGTAKGAKVKGYTVAGKTGTAQNSGDDHKLFIGFAPYENPTIAIVCIAENAEDITPSPAIAYAQRFLTEYFKYYPVKEIAQAEVHETTNN